MSRDPKWFETAIQPEDHRWHGDLLALDPGVTSPGVALFRHGVLIAAGRVKLPPDFANLSKGDRWLRIGHEIVQWWDKFRTDQLHVIRTVVYECPQIYVREKSKGDPNQLIGLAGVGQSLAVMLYMLNLQHAQRPPELLTPLPAEWTGQLPKMTKGDPWKSPRGARVAGRLQSGERAEVPSQHDAIDAVGLGLWALGRYSNRRIFPGAT